MSIKGVRAKWNVALRSETEQCNVLVLKDSCAFDQPSLTDIALGSVSGRASTTCFCIKQKSLVSSYRRGPTAKEKDQLTLVFSFVGCPWQTHLCFATMVSLSLNRTSVLVFGREQHKTKTPTVWLVFCFGCPWQTRTDDKSVNSRLLYLLS